MTRLKGCTKYAGTCAGLILVFLQTLRLRIAYNAQRRKGELSTRDAHDDGRFVKLCMIESKSDA